MKTIHCINYEIHERMHTHIILPSTINTTKLKSYGENSSEIELMNFFIWHNVLSLFKQYRTIVYFE